MGDMHKITEGQNRLKQLHELIKVANADEYIIFAAERMGTDDMEMFWDDFASAEAYIQQCRDRLTKAGG